MALFDIFRPDWKNSDWNIRLRAIKALSDDQETLFELAQNDPQKEVRLAAAKQLKDPSKLEQLTSASSDKEITRTAAANLNNIFRDQLLEKGQDEESIALIPRITDDAILADIVRKTDNVRIKMEIINNLSAQKILGDLTKENCGKEFGLSLLGKITDPEILQTVAAKGSNKAVRNAAQEKLDSLQPQSESASLSETAVHKLEAICSKAESLVDSLAFQQTGLWYNQAQSEWMTHDPEGTSPLIERFLAAKNRFEEQRDVREKQIEEEKQRILAKQETENRKEAICQRLEALSVDDPELLEKLEEINSEWSQLGQLPESKEQGYRIRFETCAQELGRKVSIAQEEQETAAELEQLCLKVENLAETAAPEELIESESLYHWPETTLETICVEDLKNRFDTALGTILERLESYQEALDSSRKERLQKLEDLVNRISSIDPQENPGKAHAEVREAKDTWRQLNGNSVPELREKYQKHLDKFYDKFRETREMQKWNEWHNKTRLEELVQRVEALSEENDLPRIAAIIREAQQEWKSIGHAGKEASQELWEKFHAACDLNFARCKEFFEEQRKRRETNLEQALELLEQAKSGLQTDIWKEGIELCKSLQKNWKALGPLPREKGQEAYKEFRSLCDAFFDRLRDHDKEIDSHREENQKIKEELIEEIQKLNESDNPKNVPDCLAIQKKWKEIGPGLREDNQKLWDTFRKECDKFFKSLDVDRDKNLERKEILCKKAEEIYASITEETNRKEIAEQLIALQKEWKTIGHVPKEKSDEIWNRFRTPCDKFFEEEHERFEVREAERETNYLQKLPLVEKAETLQSETNWKETAEQLKSLQKEYKEIGPAPRQKEQELYKRLRAACDTFFNRRNNHYKQMDNRREENMRQKEALIAELEMLLGENKQTSETEAAESTHHKLDLADELQLAFEANFATAAREAGGQSVGEGVRRIQAAWKNTGPAPRQYDQKLWEEFKTLLDTFYQNKKTD